MRKTILVLIILACSSSLFAQGNDSTQSERRSYRWWYWPRYENVHMKGWEDITAGIGVISGRQILYALGGERGPEVTRATPTSYVSYKYFLFRRIALGVTLGTQSLWGNSNAENNGWANPYTFRDFTTTLAFEMTWVYFQRRTIMLYGHFGLGASFISERQYFSDHTTTQNGFSPNFQYTPYGMRVGRSFAGFIEFGLGYKGLINAGLSYDFKSDRRLEKNVKKQ